MLDYKYLAILVQLESMLDPSSNQPLSIHCQQTQVPLLQIIKQLILFFTIKRALIPENIVTNE
jgi:hypothetical protein